MNSTTINKETEERIKNTARRLQRIMIQPEMLLHIFTSQGDDVALQVVESSIPRDAIFRGCVLSAATNMWNVFFSHESFDEIPEDKEIPLSKPIQFRKIHLDLGDNKNDEDKK